MANTTFSGPVRSENGFDIINKDSDTGEISDISQLNDATKDTGRYYLTSYFKKRPAINASLSRAKNWDR